MPNSGPIQTYPQGLLGFLQIKNNGKYPALLPDSLQPVIEQLRWMLETNAESTVGTDAAIAAAGTAMYLTVPEGEFWCVHDCVANVVLAAAATYVGVPAYRLGPVGSLSFARPLARLQQWAEATHGATVVIPAELYMPIFLPPGGQIGIRTTALSAPTTAGNVVARITRLPA